MLTLKNESSENSGYTWEIDEIFVLKTTRDLNLLFWVLHLPKELIMWKAPAHHSQYSKKNALSTKIYFQNVMTEGTQYEDHSSVGQTKHMVQEIEVVH